MKAFASQQECRKMPTDPSETAQPLEAGKIYGAGAIACHWTMFVLVAIFGILGLLLPEGLGAISRRLSSPVHRALYALMFLIPILGVVTFVYHDRIFNLGLFQIDFGIKQNRAIFSPTEDIQGYLAYALFALAGLHALAALWHPFYLHDGVLARMWQTYLEARSSTQLRAPVANFVRRTCDMSALSPLNFRSTRTIRLTSHLALALGITSASMASAQTDEIQVYDAAIAPVGAFNLTVHDNYTLSGSQTPEFPGAIIPDKSLNGVAEWAYGVAPWFEAGLYFPLYSITSNGSALYNGFKLRGLFVTPDAVKRAFFYGVNFEFSFNTTHWDQRSYTSEIRPIIGTHIGRFDLIFNPILDNSWNGLSKLEFVPETRVAMALSEKYKVALEEYDGFGSVSHFLPAARQTHLLFGVIDFNTKLVGIEMGLGAGLNSASDHLVFKLILTRDL
ncbi:MAG: cytochrome b/b6 domain-containing protein [Steroidobacteraceae bacterium]